MSVRAAWRKQEEAALREALARIQALLTFLDGPDRARALAAMEHHSRIAHRAVIGLNQDAKRGKP